jgi:2'-5' RNA ligase
MTHDARDTARLFFAAWPGPDVQDALHEIALQARNECGGRAIAARNIHLTLAFLGNVGRTRMAELEALAGATAGSSCDLVVDRIGFFRESRVVWAGVERCPDGLSALVSALSAALRAIEFRLDRRPYVPHATLLRNARRGPPGSGTGPIAWPVRDFALVESVQRGGERIYEVLRRWPLRG